MEKQTSRQTDRQTSTQLKWTGKKVTEAHYRALRDSLIRHDCDQQKAAAELGMEQEQLQLYISECPQAKEAACYAAIVCAGGVISDAAQILGTDFETLSQAKASSPALHAAVIEGEQLAIDLARSSMMYHLRKKSESMTRFVLNAKAGFTKQTEQEQTLHLGSYSDEQLLDEFRKTTKNTDTNTQ